MPRPVQSWDNRASAAALWTGEQLELKAGGEAQQQQFWEQVGGRAREWVARRQALAAGAFALAVYT